MMDMYALAYTLYLYSWLRLFYNLFKLLFWIGMNIVFDN